MYTKCTLNKIYQGKAQEVTIVVLIILAGITLNAVIGEDGIIFQAKDTKNLISNETAYDNQQLAQLQNELKDNQLYSGIGIIPGTDTGGSSEGGENGTITPPGGDNQQGGTNQGGSNTNTGGDNTNTGTGDNENKNATVKPANSQNQNPGGGTLVGGKTDEDPLIYVVSGEEIAASFYQSDVTIQIYTKDRTKKIKYILTTTVPEISNELYPSGLVRELDIENGGTLTFTKDGEYTITAYAYDTAGNKSNPTIMWLKRQVGGSTTGGITVSVASGNEGANKWFTSNVTLRVLGTDTGSSEVRYRVQGRATSTGQIGDKEVTGVGNFDSGEVKIANGTTFRIVADGTYTITAYSYDAGGMRISSSEVLNLKKDATRPTVQSFTGEQITGSGFKVSVKAVDTGSGLTTNAYTYRHRLAETNGEYTSEVSGNTSKTYTGLNQQKTYDMYVVVTDQAGNMAITDIISRPSLYISNNITVGETVSNGAEGARKYSRSDTVALTFRGQDSNNVDISKTTYQILGTVTKEGSIAGNTVTVGQELKDEYMLNDKETKTIQLQADGNWIVKVHNYNKEGKLVSTNVIDVTRDITVPTITDIAKTGTGASTLNVKVTANDDASGFATKNDAYTYYLNNTSQGAKTANTHSYTGINWTTKPSTISTKVVVKDKAGNTSEKTVSLPITYTAKDFTYTGSAQSYTAKAGTYILEVWGAQGGSCVNAERGKGGLGGYAIGTLSVTESKNFYICIGGTSNSIAGGWNGGGRSTASPGCGGGGATDIRVNANGLYNRLIVAGGGGGAGGFATRETYESKGGTGGGTNGGNGTGTNSRNGVGATQNGGGASASDSNRGNGSFGSGGDASGAGTSGGGGGGWYGGGGGYDADADNDGGGGGGGSGYVLTASSYKPSGYALGSEYYLTDASTTAGQNSGNGKARITLVE